MSDTPKHLLNAELSIELIWGRTSYRHDIGRTDFSGRLTIVDEASGMPIVRIALPDSHAILGLLCGSSGDLHVRGDLLLGNAPRWGMRMENRSHLIPERMPLSLVAARDSERDDEARAWVHERIPELLADGWRCEGHDLGHRNRQDNRKGHEIHLRRWVPVAQGGA